jgi:undecaprenyl-diphosphatase
VRTTQTAPSGTSWTRRPADAITAAVGLGVLVIGMVLVRDGSVSALEEDVFHAINDLPDALSSVSWPLQQLGALLIGPVVAIVAALARRYRLAAAALIVTAAKLVLERVVKAIVTRERPGTSIDGAINARGDVSIAGESFVSGHAVLATALAGVITPYLPGRWKLVPWIVVVLVACGRVYVGAHNPLDVVCGAGLGLFIAGLTNLALGVPATKHVAETEATVR